jgi:hypothetical protein
MKTHIQTVVGHFKDQCSGWDVVNEALNLDGTVSTTNNIWAQTIGPSYIDIAFQTAHQAWIQNTAKISGTGQHSGTANGIAADSGPFHQDESFSLPASLHQ